MKLTQFVNIWLLFVTTVLAVQPFKKVWENTQYSRVIDVGKSFVKERHDIQVTNIDSEPAIQYLFGLPKHMSSDATLVVAIYATKDGKRALLKPQKIPVQDEDLTYFDLKFPYPIAPGSTFEFILSFMITNQMVPYPEHIPMEKTQVIKLNTYAYPLTSYDTISYSLDIANTKSVTELNLDDLPILFEKVENERSVSFVASDLIEGNTVHDFTFTYPRNLPLTYINYLQRDLWVSHWSNTLQLEEYYELTNHGAKLDKGFSRSKYMTESIANKPHHAITALRIPFDHSKALQYDSIYYVDKVGNVSTSQYYENELIIRPRFPIFGGWNYNFTIGWDYKLDQFVKQQDDEYIITTKILDGIQDSTYDKVNFTIYLPEGAELLDYALPFAVAEPTITNQYSYLDVESGHLKVTFEFENLVDEMKNLSIVIRYKYTTYAMLHKPLHAAFYIFLALMGLYVLKKIDLSIKPNEKSDKIESEEVEIIDKDEKSEN